MADQEPNGGGNGADDNSQPQVSIFAQYVKDLSVENPSARDSEAPTRVEKISLGFPSHAAL